MAVISPRVPIIKVEDAQIKTAAISIKALVVNGKQLTLAVFRQLQLEELISDAEAEAIIRGPVWGKINYHADKCENAMSHTHFVWQKGNELRRSYTMARYWAREWAEDIEKWRLAAEARAQNAQETYERELSKYNKFKRSYAGLYLKTVEEAPHLFIAI